MNLGILNINVVEVKKSGSRPKESRERVDKSNIINNKPSIPSNPQNRESSSDPRLKVTKSI